MSVRKVIGGFKGYDTVTSRSRQVFYLSKGHFRVFSGTNQSRSGLTHLVIQVFSIVLTVCWQSHQELTGTCLQLRRTWMRLKKRKENYFLQDWLMYSWDQVLVYGKTAVAQCYLITDRGLQLLVTHCLLRVKWNPRKIRTISRKNVLYLPSSQEQQAELHQLCRSRPPHQLRYEERTTKTTINKTSILMPGYLGPH